MKYKALIIIVLIQAFLQACGGGGGASFDAEAVAPPGPEESCTGQCANAQTFLSAAEVQRVIAQAAAEALANNAAGTIAVVDRSGNVLGVFRMQGAAAEVAIRSTPPGGAISGGLENLTIIPDVMAAIAKAVTGAYLASEGNAFTTRTASQIVQEHFNPGEIRQPGGPLFGVQFSQLPCSDLTLRYPIDGDAGPKRSPLGLSADPGGLPLYIAGTPVGGIGVIADGLYGLDKDVSGRLDNDLDERIALAGSFGFAAPVDRRADHITADGKLLRFSDTRVQDLVSDPVTAPALSAIAGSLVAVAGYTDGAVRAGTAYGQPASGVRPDVLDYPGRDAFVLVDQNNVERFRPRAGTEATGALLTDEVREIIDQALGVANRARAQIRRPLGSQARVTIAVVDTSGTVLGLARTRDAPTFGIDASLQKARTAAFFSSAGAAADLTSLPPAAYLDETVFTPGTGDLRPPLRTVDFSDYIESARTFLGAPTALSDGAFAFSDRAGGNLSRPYYPDGIDGNPPGPFSKPPGQWSVFSVGMQLDIVYNALIHHVAFVAGIVADDVARNCSGVIGIDDPARLFEQPAPVLRLANGIQTFPGSVPIYRGDQLVGGIGVSGDGVDQDDMISFLGLHLAAQQFTGINNAAAEIRADQLTPMGVRLRFINCPQTPFIDSDEQNVCQGK